MYSLNTTWITWFFAVVLPGTVTEVALQVHGLPLLAGLAFMIFVLVIGVAVAETMEIIKSFDQIEIENDEDIQGDIDRELNG